MSGILWKRICKPNLSHSNQPLPSNTQGEKIAQDI